MVIISNIEAAVLGLLCEKQMYAYEIEKQIEYRSMRTWTEIAFSSIYYVLHKLEKTELVLKKVRLSEKGIARKVYSVTAKGRKAMQEKVLNIISSYTDLIDPMMLGIYNLNNLTPQQAEKALKLYEQSLDKAIEGYNNLKNFLIKSGCPFYHQAFAERSLFHLEAEKKWLIDFLSKGVKNE